MTVMIAIALSCFIIIDAFIWYANNRVAQEAKPLAWADIVLDSSRSWTDESTQRISDIVWNQWTISKRISLNTNITTPTDSRLVQLLWVDWAYPLYGTITVEPIAWRTFAFWQWVAVDAKTYSTLSGDQIQVGETILDVDWIIQENPWLTLNLFTQWRQVIIPLDKMKQTWLLRLGSRSEYEYLIKVTDTNNSKELIDKLRDDTYLSQQWDVDDYQWRVQQVGTLLDELGVYLLLVIFCWFLLVAVTSMLSIDEYIYRRLRTISIMQILWAQKKYLFMFYWLLFLAMVILSTAIAIGSSILIAQQVSLNPIVSWFAISNSAIRQWIWVSIVLTIVAWSLPLLKILLRSPLAWLSESTINLTTSQEKIASLSITVIGIIVVLRIIWESRIQTAKLAWILLGWYILIRGIIQLLLRIWNYINKKYNKNFILFDAIRSTTRPWNTSTLIASTLIVALTTTLLITQFGGSFIDRLTFNSDNQPNWYLVNITKNDLQVLRENNIKDPAYNVVLWRIISINNASLNDYLALLPAIWWEGWRWRFTREFNITTVPLNSKDTIAWKDSVAKWEVSVDQEFAKDLWLKLWDTVVFSIAWKESTHRITWLRQTNRTNFSPFFFFQLNEEEFVNAPMTYFMTLQVAEEKKDTTRKTISTITRPWVAFIEIDTIISSIRTITERIIEIVEVLLWVILLFACFTTIVCVENMRYAKAFKMKIYNILWATNKKTRQSVIYEYAYILWIAIISSIALWRWVAWYFINASDFLTWSRNASIQWMTIIVAIILLNTIVIQRTMKK